MSDPAGFVAWCDQLRAAGVVKLGALVLGTKPRDPSAAKEPADPDAEAYRQHRTMFASSRIAPPFVPPVRDGGVPRAVAQRLVRDEASANGTSKPSR